MARLQKAKEDKFKCSEDFFLLPQDHEHPWDGGSVLC
jgi:hypothetical protein